MSTATLIPGGWSLFRPEITPEEKEIFEAVLGKLEGVGYTPIAVSTQVVAGTNYRFLANATVIYPGATNNLALVVIFKPLEGSPYLTRIKVLDLD